MAEHGYIMGAAVG